MSLKKRQKQNPQPPPPPPPPFNTPTTDMLFRRGSSMSMPDNSGRSSVAGGHSKQINPAASTKNINAYLQSHNCNILLPSKGLPSAKDVRGVTSFLIRELDPAYEIRRLEDDVPFLLKSFAYPGQLTKNAFTSAGSPHTWPVLVAALSWVVQLLKYQERVNMDNIVVDEDFNFVLASYDCFLRGDDASLEAHTVDYVGHLKEADAAGAKEVAEKESAIRELKVRIESLEPGHSLVEKLQRNRIDLATDVKKFRALVDNLTNKKESMEKSFEDKETELGSIDREIVHECKVIEDAKVQIESQPVDVWGFKNMEKELQCLDSEIASLEEVRKMSMEKQWDLDQKVAKELRQLEADVDQCNEEIKRLKLPDSFEFKLKLIQLASTEVETIAEKNEWTPTDILGVDIKEKLKPFIISKIDEQEKNQRSKWDESIDLQKQADDKSAEQEKKREQNNALLIRIKTLESECTRKKKMVEEYISSMASEANRLLAEAEKVEEEQKINEAEVNTNLTKAREDLEGLERAYDEKINATANELLGLVDKISNLKLHVDTTIKTVRAGFNEAVKEMENSTGIKWEFNKKAMISSATTKLAENT